jgi:5-(carboxyamino)imidazole ribonucleotide synthase
MVDIDVNMTSENETANARAESAKLILPGATIGMVGGGQLGRMFAIAAASMGYEVVVFCGKQDDPAAQVAHRVVTGRLDDHQAVSQFARSCDVITLEFENIPADTIAKCGDFAPTYPASSVLATAQDRLLEKSTFRDAGLPVTPFCEVVDAASLCQQSSRLDWPVIVKSARSGYDGKGQYRVESPQHADTVPWSDNESWIAERCISFDREISVIVARSADGSSICYPPFENEHRNHILDVTVWPAAVSEDLTRRAKEVALAAAECIGVVGLLCVEMFVVKDGDVESLMINEVAPRPHNSGHLTIEAAQASQFQQHVRAICGLPFGGTELVCGGAAMANLLGDLWHHDQPPAWDRALSVPGVNLHLYGKGHAQPGRKMGHLTATGASVSEARGRVLAARGALEAS